MVHMITFDEEMQKIPPERQAKIEARTKELQNQLNTIKQIREELGISQTDLAQCLGVQQSTVSKLENDRSNLTLGKLATVVNALG